MENIGEVLRACGLGFADTVKFTIMLADMRRWAEFNAVYLEYFDPDRPAGALGVRRERAGARRRSRGRMRRLLAARAVRARSPPLGERASATRMRQSALRR